MSSAVNCTDQPKGSFQVTASGCIPQEVSLSVPQSGQTHAGQLAGPALSTAQGGQSMPLLQTGYSTMSTPKQYKRGPKFSQIKDTKIQLYVQNKS